MAVINRVKSVLAEKQLTGKWLAEHIEKSENTISKWCSNKGQPSLVHLVKIATTLDFDIKIMIGTASSCPTNSSVWFLRL